MKKLFGMLLVISILIGFVHVTGTVTGISDKLQPISPANNAKVMLANDTVAEWSKDYSTFISRNYFGKGDQFAPQPLTVSWTSADTDSYIFRIGTNKTLTDAKEYTVDTNEVCLEGLYTGTVYYWQVSADIGGNTKKSAVYCFSTAYTRRTIYLDGVTNTRDIGGIELESGGRIKQGMVYRGANLDTITDDAKEKQKKFYGIKTDLDLRRSSEVVVEGGSPLGSEINYVNISAPNYKEALADTANHEAVRNIIKLFANEDNYPIYFHCAIGRDRTGTIALLLEGLLGATQEEMYRDYEMTYLSTVGCSQYSSSQNQFAEQQILNSFMPMYNWLGSYGNGNTYAEHIESYLLDIGVTQQEIDSIRNILIEE